MTCHHHRMQIMVSVCPVAPFLCAIHSRDLAQRWYSLMLLLIKIWWQLKQLRFMVLGFLNCTLKVASILIIIRMQPGEQSDMNYSCLIVHLAAELTLIKLSSNLLCLQFNHFNLYIVRKAPPFFVTTFTTTCKLYMMEICLDVDMSKLQNIEIIKLKLPYIQFNKFFLVHSLLIAFVQYMLIKLWCVQDVDIKLETSIRVAQGDSWVRQVLLKCSNLRQLRKFIHNFMGTR